MDDSNQTQQQEEIEILESIYPDELESKYYVAEAMIIVVLLLT